MPPPPPGFKLDGGVPPPPPGFEVETPDFSDVKGGSSSTNPTYWEGVKSRFNTAIHNPMEAIGGALDPLLKPVRESLQQGGITGDLGPDIAKQAFGPKAGGFAAGVEREVAPGLASGENAAIMGALAAAPQTAPFLMAKFGKEGAQSAIAASQAPPNETPEEAGRRYAQMAGGAAMAVAPLIHAGAGPVREAVSRFKEPAARLDFDAVAPEDLAPPQNTVSRFNLAESDKAFKLARDKQAALDAMKKFEEELPEPPAPKVEEPPPVEPVGRPGFAEDQGFDPRVIKDFNDWADRNRPAHDDLPQRSPKPWAEGEKLEVPREIQDAADEVPEASQLEIQQAAERLRRLDESAREPGAAGDTATGSLGESAGAAAERAADPAARSTEPLGDRATEAGEGPIGAQNVGAPAAGAEGVPVEQPDLTLRSIRDFQRQAGVPEYEGSRFSRSNQGIRDAVVGNEAELVARGKAAKIGEALSDEVQYALKKYNDDLVRNGGDQNEIQRNYKILAESNSAKGRQLQALQTAIDNVDHTDPAAVVGLAQKATNGKLSIQAQMDLADMSRKAGKMREASTESINKRAEAALARLEGMGEQIKRLTIKDVIGCP